MPSYNGISASVIRRLPRYYRFLNEMKNSGVERISSKEFAKIIGLTASQIRQDLNCFGGFGQQGYGYNVQSLHNEIGRILSLDKAQPTILLGAGNLGLALVNHMDFLQRGFKLCAIFDNSPEKIGQKVVDYIIKDIFELENYCRQYKIMVAVLCIPQQSAEIMVGKLVELGVCGFWNFSHYDIGVTYGSKVAVENVHLGDSLMTLSFNVNNLD